MCTLYENIIVLCRNKGITGSKMCTDLGISRSILTGLKNGTKKSVSSETLQRFADYLGVTTDYLLGTENRNSPDESKLTEAIPGYEELNETNKAIVQSMIDQLLAAQSNR